jgi:hypothetical protein
MGIINKPIGDMNAIINHDYMNNFTKKIQEKSDKIRRDNQAKIRRLRDYGGYKVNNASMKRSTEIKKHYLSSTDDLRDPSKVLSSHRNFFSPQKQKPEYFRSINNGMGKNFMVEATRPAYN